MTDDQRTELGQHLRGDLRLGGLLAGSVDAAEVQVQPAAAAQPATFQVVYEDSDRLIIGVGDQPDNRFAPGADFGPDYPIATLDLAWQRAVLDNPNAYLCADGQTVQPQPC
jgi:hypothetical protein